MIQRYSTLKIADLLALRYSTNMQVKKVQSIGLVHSSLSTADFLYRV